MALVLADRVEQVTRTTGTADLELAETLRGRQSFQDVTSDGDTVIYVLEDVRGSEWEIGLGTVTHGTPTILERTTVRQSSNSDAKINLSAGTHRVYLTADAEYYAEKASFSAITSAVTAHEQTRNHPSATTAAPGFVEKATTQEAEQASVDKFPDAAGVHAAFMRYGLKQSKQIAPGTDINTVVDSGFYRLEYNHPNIPPNNSGEYGQMIVSRGGDTITQMIGDFNGSELWFRSGNPPEIGGGGSWGSWKRTFHTGNVATTADNEAGVSNDIPTTPKGVHEAFNQYGLGVSEPSTLATVDDHSLKSGVYKSDSSTTLGTLPQNASIADVVFVLKAATNQTTQIISQPNGGPTFIRKSYSTDGWEPWRILYNSGNILGTVSQSGGVPTGAIIERGSNANGEYVKYADGTMECFKKNFVMSYVFPARLSATWTFPASFAVSPVVGHCMNLNDAFVQGYVIDDLTSSTQEQASTTGVVVHQMSKPTQFTSGDTLRTDIRAIGRWF